MQAQATVNKRVLIGAAATVLLGAFALVPSESLDGGASKPVSFYLVPVLRSVVRLLPTTTPYTCPVPQRQQSV